MVVSICPPRLLNETADSMFSLFITTSVSGNYPCVTGIAINGNRLVWHHLNPAPNPTPNPTPVPNPIPNCNCNLNVSLRLSQTNAKPDACANNYLAIVRKYYNTKTADLQTEHKYTTITNLCIRVQMSDASVFWYNMI